MDADAASTRSTFDNDEFWEALAPAMFSATRWERASADVDGILALTHPAPGARVLDLCCGTGRIALDLARRGLRVTGVDRTKSYLEEAGRRAEAAGLEVELVLEDVRNFVRAAEFELAVNFYTSFGLFDSVDEDRRVIRNLHESLKPGGSVLIDVMGREVLAKHFRARDWQRLEDGSIFMEERRIVDGWSAVESTWSLLTGGNARSFTFRLRLYAGTELAAMLEGLGFGDVQIFGGVDGRPYDENAERLVVVAQKQARPKASDSAR